MSTTPKFIRRNGGYCDCPDRKAVWENRAEGTCRYGYCAEFRCRTCHGKLGGWGPVGCKCDNDIRWARHPNMAVRGHWDNEKGEYVRIHVAIKPSIAKRRNKRAISRD